MKNVLRKSYLLWLSLLLFFSVILFLNVTNGVVINTKPIKLHESSLYWLYLSGVDEHEDSWLNIGVGNEFLSVLNWLIIWNFHDQWSTSKFITIWWWSGNAVKSDNAWIGWWQRNTVNGFSERWAIWWWNGNTVDWIGWVVVWWASNVAGNLGAVLWWRKNKIKGDGMFWVVLWWSGNVVWNNGLVLWKNSDWGSDSFSWNNPEVWERGAGINADSWVLIWTYNPKESVALVVGWAVKLWKNQEPVSRWEIDNKEWCIKVHDWASVHVLGKTSESESQCGAGKWCQFGRTMMQHGDKITTTSSVIKAYKKPYSTGCVNERIEVTCNNWNLESSQSSTIYSYCYTISDNPTMWH